MNSFRKVFGVAALTTALVVTGATAFAPKTTSALLSVEHDGRAQFVGDDRKALIVEHDGRAVIVEHDNRTALLVEHDHNRA